MKVTYIGDARDPSGDHEEINWLGHTFPKGKAVTVPDDHPNADLIKANRTFKVGKEKPEAEVAPVGDVDVSDPATDIGHDRHPVLAQHVDYNTDIVTSPADAYTGQSEEEREEVGDPDAKRGRGRPRKAD